ncbi:MAG: TonB-dependent receptor plug domain-containing protein [Ignavibacteriae bacterium]|nr:TonB-dependent receptor plug domain-containing protein [Ignavibacteriota bacterium]
MKIQSSSNKIIFIFLFALLVFLSNISSAQQSGKFRGVVTDSLSGEVLAYANVFIKNLGIGTSTDSRGYFLISSLPINENYTAEISYLGYKKQTIYFRISQNKITHVNVALYPLELELQTIEKSADKVYGENVTDIGIQKLSAKKIEALPKGVEPDIFRALQYLPGIQSSSDISARFHVRGGGSNQNQFLLDDISIYNPFHALGLFGAIDPEVINNVELHIGGFSAEHAGRLSSVIKMISKDGNKNQYHALASSSFMSFKGLAQGPIPQGSFILSGRKSYSNKVLNNFLDDKNIPIDFYDIFVKLNYSNDDFLPNAKFSIVGFASGDNILNNNPLISDVKWNNSAIGLTWFQFTQIPLFYSIQASVSQFDGELIPNNSGTKPIKNKVIDYTAKLDVSYVFDNKDEIVFGTKIKEVQTDLFLQNSVADIKNIGPNGAHANIGIYLKYKFLRFLRFNADIGSRLNLVGLSRSGKNKFFEPRISMSYNFSEKLSFKSAFGVYLQEITTLSDEDEVITYFEPWFITPRYIPPARATHYISGFEWKVGQNISVDIEGYYKTVKNLPGLNENKIFITDNELVSGSSEAYGIDFLFRFNHALFNFTTSYSHGYVTKNINNQIYNPRYDIRNSIKTILELNVYKGWKASATWIYYSGVPFTLLTGYYDKLNFDNPVDKFSYFGSQIVNPILGERNTERLPQYHRMDLSISKNFKLSFLKFYLNFSIINLYDRANIFYFSRDTGKRVNMLPFLPTAIIKVEL